MSKEIWFVDQYIGHPRYGNVYRNFYISKELTKQGYKVRIFSASYSHLMYSLPENSKELIDGVEFNWIRVKPYSDGKSLGRIISIFEFALKIMKLRKQIPPDIIITPSVSFIPYWPVYLINKYFWKKKVKLILEIRDLWPLSLTVLGGISKGNPFIKLLSITEKHAYEHVDSIISTLKMCDKHIYTVTDKPIMFNWIDNGIDIPNDSIELPDDIIIQIPQDKFVIGYAGALGLANSMIFLVEAAQKLQSNTNIHFVIVGDGYEKDNLKEMSNGLNNITFIPRISKSFIPKILSLFNVLYLSYANAPSLYKYGVSANKTYEYMMASKPIILSCVEMDYNIIKEANCGIVIEPENSDAIVEAIQKLIAEKPEFLEEMGENGRRYVLENNTFEILTRKLMDVVENV